MPYIQLRDRQFSIRRGHLRVGTSADADVRIPGEDSPAAQAVVEMGADDHVAIRRGGPEAVVRVNGVQLGVEPTPLMHGDKIEIAGVDLFFGDDRRAGSTQYLGTARAAVPVAGPASGKATAATGGRLVSLVDGREYTVPADGLTIGRDAGCEVVVPATEVSRRHAMVTPGEGGYVLTDLSTNGVLVNGERVARTRTLGRGDVIRVGPEEFRFHADLTAAPGPPAAPAPGGRLDTPQVAVPPSVMAGIGGPDRSRPPLSAQDALPQSGGAEPGTGAPPRAAGPPSAAGRPAEASPSAGAAPPAEAAPPAAPAPAAPPPAPASAAAPTPPVPVRAYVPQARPPEPAEGTPKPRPALATLEIINEGVLRGKRFEIRTPLTHLGRGAHNDIVVADESVSDSHAKIQRRESGWYVVDMGSTNGTYVGGRRIMDEKQLVGSPDIRFGGIKMVFQAAADGAEDARGTRAIAGMRPQARQASAAAAARATPPVSGQPAGDEPAQRVSGWLWLVIAMLVAAAAAFVMWGRP